MQEKWTILYGALAALTLLFAWHHPCRRIAWALFANVVFTYVMGSLLPIETSAGVNVIAEVGILCIAAVSLLDCTRMAMVLMLLSLGSILISLGYSMKREVGILLSYEEMVNAVFVVQCFVVLNVGLWSVVGDRIGRLMRWRALRRHPRNALRRMGLATTRRD